MVEEIIDNHRYNFEFCHFVGRIETQARFPRICCLWSDAGLTNELSVPVERKRLACNPNGRPGGSLALSKERGSEYKTGKGLLSMTMKKCLPF